MKIQIDTIHFKSYPGQFADEQDGTKPNTVRLLSAAEAREIEVKWGEVNYIVIQKSTSGASFTRELSDVSDITEAMGKEFTKKICPSRLYVFSWKT